MALFFVFVSCHFLFASLRSWPFGPGEESTDSSHSLANFAVPSLRTMACILEPTAAEFVTMKSLSDVTQWVQVQVPSHLADAWFDKLGATGKDSPSIVGMLSHEEDDAEVATIRIDDRPLSLLQKGLLCASLHVCQLVAGVVQSSAAPAPSVPDPEPRSEVPGPTPTPGVSGPQVALKQVISQGSEETVPKLSPQDLSLHWTSSLELTFFLSAIVRPTWTLESGGQITTDC